MDHITLIFPDQLFINHPGIAPGRTIVLAEEFLFYKVQPFHKQRLALLRAAMQAYAEKLVKNKSKVIYIPASDLNRRGDLFARLAKMGVKAIHLTEFADEWLSADLMAASTRFGWAVHFYPSPGFICSAQEIHDFFSGKEHYSMAQFYSYQRKKLDILMDGSRPMGGKYSFDVQNRKKIPKSLPIPATLMPENSPQIDRILREVEQEFQTIGDAAPVLYATTHVHAHEVLIDFLKNKLTQFGDYQDAMRTDNSTLFHSVLSPLLNIGLLTPLQVVHTTLDYANENEIPINSLEGFIRQVMGWREFVRAAYLLKGVNQRTCNFFQHHQKIPSSFWKGSTGIVPIDTIIQRILKTGYCNHIERLMVLGNFLLLTETSPHEVYEWFMANFIDAYDWVMVPNIYGMSQYADGGMIVTKPYISGSNYILKMSNYAKGEWAEIWDGLFWRFLHIHKNLFGSNNRTSNLINLLAKNEHSILPKIRKAEFWLESYRK